MADIQNETEDKAQDVNSKIDAQGHEVVNKDDASQNAEVKFKSTMADLPLTTDQDDLLGMKIYQNALIDFIEHSDTPVAFALQGAWGSGKTSLMNAVDACLCKSDKPLFHSIWINTWQYSLMATPSQAIIGILHSIIDQIGFINPKSKHLALIKEQLTKILPLAISMGYVVADKFALVDALKLVGIDATKIKEWSKKAIVKSNEKDKMSNPFDLVIKLKTEIKALIHEILEPKKTKSWWCKSKSTYSTERGFLFFIDDVDRIDPVLAIAILEILKNIFDIEGCVFIVAVDNSVIVKGLEPKLGKLNDQNRFEYQDYLDKFFQASINVPVLFYDIKLLIKKMFVDCQLFQINELSDKELKDFESIVKQTIGTNPRRIKKRINEISLSFLSARYYEQRDFSFLERKIAFILVCIGVAFVDIFQLLVINPYFISWNRMFVNKIGLLQIDDATLCYLMESAYAGMNYSDRPFCDWEKALFIICWRVPSLRGNFVKILNLLRMIDELYKTQNPHGDYKDLIAKMFLFVNRDSGVVDSLSTIVKSPSPQDKT